MRILQEHCCSMRVPFPWRRLVSVPSHVKKSGGKSWTSGPLQPMNQARSRQHQQAELEAEGVHSEQHQNFQVNATSCFRYLGNENGQKKSTWDRRDRRQGFSPQNGHQVWQLKQLCPQASWLRKAPAFSIMCTGQEDSHLRFFLSKPNPSPTDNSNQL